MRHNFNRGNNQQQTQQTLDLQHCLTNSFQIFTIAVIQKFDEISNICGALRDLVAFVQFKKRKKHPWRSVTFSKVAG